MENNDLTRIIPQRFTCCEPPHLLKLKNGQELGPISVTYETYGTLNADRSNAILILHALTGDAHAAGRHSGERKPGWWHTMIGPGKAFDTEKYFIICSNVLGGCQGTTGPASINAATGKPFGMTFPVICIQDMVAVQKILIDHLGIKKLLNVAGGSMGGLQALEWVVAYPEMVHSAVVIATNYRHSAQQIALHVVGRRAIMADPDWREGDYYGQSIPAKGLALARMIGHITYMSEKSMDEKFGRKLSEKNGADGKVFSADFEVENYLRYRGDSFVQRFDANSYLYLTKAVDNYDLTETKSLKELFRDIRTKFLVITFASDWLYPSYQLKDLVKALKANQIDVSDVEINSDYGHDAFLIPNDGQTHVVTHFLARMQRGYKL